MTTSMNTSVHVSLQKQQYERITRIAETKYNGNFSKALRLELAKTNSAITGVKDSGNY